MTTGIDALDTTVQKTNVLLNELAADLGWEDRKQQAYSLLRAVLHTLRDRLPATEAVNFGAQLPMLLRGMYYEGWKPESAPVKMDREEFLQNIRQQFLFSTELSTPDLVRKVTRHLAAHTDLAVIENATKALPGDVAALFSLT